VVNNIAALIEALLATGPLARSSVQLSLNSFDRASKMLANWFQRAEVEQELDVARAGPLAHSRWSAER
jgi:hypothetical protein